jgi:alpha-L-fucosidase
MRHENWFYSDEDVHTVKSVEQLLGLYEYSVGRGCNLLINIGPDRRGLLPDPDRARLLEFGAEVKRRFGHPFATLESFAEEPSAAGPTWTYGPGGGFLVDQVVLQEDLTQGEHVRRFEVEAYVGGGPADWTRLWSGESLGHKAICRFPLIEAYRVRVRVTEADGPVKLRALELGKREPA